MNGHALTADADRLDQPACLYVYTQCPQCQTLYRVNAALLRAARGQVQCGRCAAVFDALTFLVEEDPHESATPPSDSGPGRQPSRKIPLPAGSSATVRPSGVPPFDPERYRSDDISDQSLEFDLPPDAVERVFVEAPKFAMPSFSSAAVLTDAAEVRLAEAGPEQEEEVDIPLTVEDPCNDPVAVEPEPESFDEPPFVQGQETWDTDTAPPPEEFESPEETPRHIVEADDATVIDVVDPGEPANDDRGATGTRLRPLAIAESGAPDEDREFGDTSGLRKRAVHFGWLAGASVLAILLLAQIVHYDRHDLVRRSTLGPMLQLGYSALGLELSPNWNLKAYQVRQWGAAAPPGAQGTLRVRASVVNTADHAQPLPLLRLSLADLAGARVGVRDFEPREYIPNLPESDRMLGAGRRIDAEVVIVDPGKDAVGFEIDVCLRDDERHVNCANDPASAT
jgi:predicted Zn finger-like uncharacterized protein